MKLLFVNYEFPPVGGGAAQASLAAAKELVALGHQVEFLTISTPDTPPLDQLEGVRTHRVHAYRRGLHQASMAGAMSFLAAASRRLPRLAAERDYDAYHYYFGLPTGLLTFVPGPHRSKPFVVSLRGSDVPGYDPRLSFLHRAMLPLTRRIWSNAARVVANSEGLRQLALSCVPRQRIEVIRNGVDLPAVDEHSSRHDHSTRILVVSRLIERKGTDVLLRALARLNDPSVSVDIAGDGPDRHRLEHLARIEGVADRVRFHGFTERTALASLYRHADIFVLTSLAESCSMALLDAMAAGLPVVATAVGGTPELVAHGVNGLLVRPQDADDLAGSLGTLTRDGAQRLRMGMLGRERAVSRHSWRSVALQYEAVFHDAIENHRRARAPANTATAHFSAAPVRRD